MSISIFKNLKKTKEKYSDLFSSLLTMFFAAVVTFSFIKINLKAYNAKNWIENTCVIDQFNIYTEKGTKGGSYYYIAVKYHYKFDDYNYIGSLYNFGDHSVQVENFQELEDTYQKGSSVSCYINPNNPMESVINNKIFPALGYDMFCDIVLIIAFLVGSIIFFRRWKIIKKRDQLSV